MLIVTKLGHRIMNVFIHDLIPLNHLRHIRLFQEPRLLIAQFKLDRLDRLVDPLFTPQAHDGIHALLPDRPRRRHHGHPDPPLLRNLLHPVDDVLVDLRLLVPDERFEEVVGCLALGVAGGPGAGEDAAGDGGPGDAADAGGAAVREHFTLLFAVDEVVVVLHGNEFVPGVGWLSAAVQKACMRDGGHLHHPFVSAIFWSIWNSQAAIELAPIYLTFPLSITSFRAFMISFFGVALSNL